METYFENLNRNAHFILNEAETSLRKISALQKTLDRRKKILTHKQRVTIIIKIISNVAYVSALGKAYKKALQPFNDFINEMFSPVDKIVKTDNADKVLGFKNKSQFLLEYKP